MVERYSHQSGEHIHEAMDTFQNRMKLAEDPEMLTPLHRNYTTAEKQKIKKGYDFS